MDVIFSTSENDIKNTLEYIIIMELHPNHDNEQIQKPNHMQTIKENRNFILVTNILTKRAMVFQSIYDCGMELGINPGSIYSVCKGITKVVKKYPFYAFQIIDQPTNYEIRKTYKVHRSVLSAEERHKRQIERSRVQSIGKYFERKIDRFTKEVSEQKQKRDEMTEYANSIKLM